MKDADDSIEDLIYKLHEKVNKIQNWLLWMSIFLAAALGHIIFGSGGVFG